MRFIYIWTSPSLWSPLSFRLLAKLINCLLWSLYLVNTDMRKECTLSSNSRQKNMKNAWKCETSSLKTVYRTLQVEAGEDGARENAHSSFFTYLHLTEAETVEDLTWAQPRNAPSPLWSFECSEFVSIWTESCEFDYRTSTSSVRLLSVVFSQPLWYWSFKRSWTLKTSSQ